MLGLHVYEALQLLLGLVYSLSLAFSWSVDCNLTTGLQSAITYRKSSRKRPYPNNSRIKVTADLRGCPPRKNSYGRHFKGKHV